MSLTSFKKLWTLKPREIPMHPQELIDGVETLNRDYSGNGCYVNGDSVRSPAKDSRIDYNINVKITGKFDFSINGELLENRGCEYRLSRRFNKSDGQLHHTETLTVDNLVGDTSIVIKYLSDEVMGDITIGDFTYQTDDTDEEAILARKLGSNVRTTFLETLEVRIPGLHALMNNPLITPRPNPVLGQLYPALRAPQV